MRRLGRKILIPMELYHLKKKKKIMLAEKEINFVLIFKVSNGKKNRFGVKL